MQLTKRDLELFKKLSLYGMLSTGQIEKLLFDGVAVTTILRRLRLLETNRYLQRVATLPTHELLWSVTEKGAIEGEVEIPKRHWSKNLLDHDYKLLSLRLAFEGNGIARSWTPEHQIRSLVFKKHGFRGMKDRVIPDALMSAKIHGRMESVAVELELTLKNETKLKKVLRHYREADDLYAVWYIVGKRSMLNQIHKVWSHYSFLSRGAKIFYSTLDEVMANPAQVGAHHLSIQIENQEHCKSKASEENHAPILNIAS
jgi:hypothetical protein